MVIFEETNVLNPWFPTKDLGRQVSPDRNLDIIVDIKTYC